MNILLLWTFMFNELLFTNFAFIGASNIPPSADLDFFATFHQKENNSVENISVKFINTSKYWPNQDIGNGNRNSFTITKFTDGDHQHHYENMENLLVQLLIFIVCAAGVSAVIILCCLICLHGMQFFSRSTVIFEDDGRVRMMSANNRVQIQRSGNHETVVRFFSVHRNPWSPDESNVESGPSRFPFEKHDLPPSYNELAALQPNEEDQDAVSSPPPPPYTPSFR